MSLKKKKNRRRRVCLVIKEIESGMKIVRLWLELRFLIKPKYEEARENVAVKKKELRVISETFIRLCRRIEYN